jgi:hypothetical protein
MKKVEELPSGKCIRWSFDPNGELLSETHSYGLLDIAIQIDYQAGSVVSELYFIKRSLVSRARYEKVRADFPDMPPADAALEDLSGDLVKSASREKRERRKALAHRPVDPEQARHIDEFCKSLMAQGEHADAITWVESPTHTLGELTNAGSKKLVQKLAKLGCESIHACDIETQNADANTGHLVVELPTDAPRRKRILREIVRLAHQQGYEGDPDDGQAYSYIKLD